ncbi:hypothetical protein ACIRQP_31975 [Streptomyces sp. NPDC102274]|uniref:hypothetical protein n=1 Tax=Streptomyces sp. NPDC102274 TaxID=3366151 RepID=UPI00382ADA67
MPTRLGLGQPGPAARVVGALGVVVAVASAPYTWRVVEPVSVRFPRPSPAMALADRADELTSQRADATVAQAAEIRPGAGIVRFPLTRSI